MAHHPLLCLLFYLHFPYAAPAIPVQPPLVPLISENCVYIPLSEHLTVCILKKQQTETSTELHQASASAAFSVISANKTEEQSLVMSSETWHVQLCLRYYFRCPNNTNGCKNSEIKACALSSQFIFQASSFF